MSDLFAPWDPVPRSMPPPGALDSNNASILWTDVTRHGRKYKAAQFDVDRVDDFVEGEGKLGHCKFSVRRVNKRVKVSVA